MKGHPAFFWTGEIAEVVGFRELVYGHCVKESVSVNVVKNKVLNQIFIFVKSIQFDGVPFLL
jgi:hypothetical protein